MTRMPELWDYLVLTASNASQAEALTCQLELRRRLGLLSRVREVIVVDDIEGRRIGSGGSTLHSLALILDRERRRTPTDDRPLEAILSELRILIVHAGGDSRRLPAYAACGKIFVPVPGNGHSALGTTVFDLLIPTLLDLPAGAAGRGQIVMASGDVLLRFDPGAVEFDQPGIVMLGCLAAPEEAARHGVFCLDAGGALRYYLQKPGLEAQRAAGAIDRHGRTTLDTGVASIDDAAAVALMRAFGMAGGLAFSPPMRRLILERGLDFYREICCAMGRDSTPEHFIRSARAAGSTWDDATLSALAPALAGIPFHVETLPHCDFLHFGSTRQLIASGLALAVHSTGALPESTALTIQTEIGAAGAVHGRESWIEGCRIEAPLSLAGHNVAIGVDVTEPLSLPEGACLEVASGLDSQGRPVWFIRCYGVTDTFKNADFCGRPLAQWLAEAGAPPEAVWDSSVPPEERTLWNARLFPAAQAPGDYRRWLWMYSPASSTAAQRQAFLDAARYSALEIAQLADAEAFHQRRARIRASEIRRSLAGVFSRESAFSAADLAFTLGETGERGAWAAEALSLARAHLEESREGGLEGFTCCRILHSLASAVTRCASRPDQPVSEILPGFRPAEEDARWLASECIPPGESANAAEWSARLEAAAFRQLHQIVLASRAEPTSRPRNALRPDETIWGRGPARMDLGGGWTDTPPYSLEYGGDVTNVAIDLNGQPPIHCYCRTILEPLIRVASIDGGSRLEIRDLDELLDFRRPGDPFALAKAALAIAGFSPQAAAWPSGVSLRHMLEEFGGGIELTTLVGIPQGSGLGASSILGAVIMAVVRRLMGRELDRRQIFHEVLRLEQALTTGGGWQDQAGALYPGAKITSAKPGLFPVPLVRYLPSDLLEPRVNGAATLLYYTGITRLAKNILAQVVGSYLDRDRAVMQTLAEEHVVAHCTAEALSRHDAPALGRYLDRAWELHQRLCTGTTNDEIDGLLARVRPYVYGMRLAGAGGGGFLLMVCKSPRHAADAREDLERHPPNDRARFFEYAVNHTGLEVATC